MEKNNPLFSLFLCLYVHMQSFDKYMYILFRGIVTFCVKYYR